MDRVSIKKIREILRLKFKSKLHHRTIGRITHASPGTISRYCSPFQQLGVEWDQLEKMNDREIQHILYYEDKHTLRTMDSEAMVSSGRQA